MKEKFIILNSLLLLVVLFASCQYGQKFNWDAGFSAPRNYIAGGPYVEYFYKGKSLAGTSSLVGINPGWGETSGGYTGGDPFKPVPDSVFVKWRCGFDLVEYEGGFKLPRKEMLALFKKEPLDPFGYKASYGLIVTGMAPGGNVTIWMNAGLVRTEIAKYKATAVRVISKDDPSSGIHLWNSTGNEAKNILRYIKVHGMPYEVWEKGEKEYDYDMGFSSEDGKIIPFITTVYSRDASWYQPAYTNEKAMSSIDLVDWNHFQYEPNNNLIKNRKLPVDLVPEWKYNNKYYITTIVMPQDLEKYFSGKGNDAPFKRIVIGVAKDNQTGKVWLENSVTRKDIMTFKVFEAIKGDLRDESGGYSLPKGYQFPKWPGRKDLTFAELNYWQEQ